MSTRQITFKLDAEGNVEQVVSKVGSSFSKLGDDISKAAQAANSSMGSFGKVSSAIGGMATVAGGIVAANIFGKIVEGLGLFATTGLSAVDSAQRLETGLGALLTMNNLYERTTETMTVAVKGFAEEQANAAKKSDDLAFKQKELTADIKRQSAAIQEQRQRIIQMADGLDKTEQVAKLEQMEVALEGMNREMADAATEQGKLNNLTQEYTTVSKTSFQQVMNFSDAQKLAADQSKDLLAYVEKLAIISPFEQDQVALVSKLAVAAGLGVEQTKNFTAGFLDLAAAVGIGSAELDFAADQLLQVAKVGKITTVDLRQLRRIGIDLEKIIGVQMGMSIEEFNDKAAKSPDIFNDLFDSVTEFSKNTFAGTAEKMATSVSGLKSTFMDIFKVSAKNLMRPLIDAVGPAASGFLGKLSDIVTGPELAKIGESIPKVLFGAFKSLQGGGEGDLFSGLKGLGLDSSTAKSITDITQQAHELFAAFQAGDMVSVAEMVGITPDIVALFGKLNDTFKDISSTISSALAPALDSISGGGIMDSINSGISFVNEHFEEFKAAIIGVGAVLGTVVAGGILASLAAGLFALLTPLNLVIAGVGLLSAAWVGNWGNIQGIFKQAVDFITQEWGTMASAVSGMKLGAMLGLETETIMQILLGINTVVTTFTALKDTWIANWPLIQAAALTGWEVVKGIFAGFQNVALIAGIQLQQAFSQITGALNSMGISWTDVWNALKTATGIVLAGIGVLLLGVVSAVGGLVTATTSAISAMVSVWVAMGGQIKVIIEGLATQFAGASMIWSGIINGEWSLIWQGFVTTVQGVFTTLKGLVGTLVTLFVGPFAIIASTVQGFITGVIAMFTGLYNTLVGHSIIPDLVNDIVQWFQQLPGRIIAALSSLVDMATEPFEEFLDAAQEILNPEKWEEIGVNIIDGVVAGIEGAKDKVLEVLKEMASQALSGVMDTLGIQSPSTEFQYIGQMMAAGVTKGWKDGEGEIFSAVSNLGDIGHFRSRGMSQTKAENLKGAWEGAVTALWDDIVSGKAGAQQLEDLTRRGAGAWAKFVDDADIKFQEAVDIIREGGAEIAAQVQKQMMDRLVTMAQGFATFGDALTNMLQQQKQPTLDVIADNEKLTKSIAEQQAKVAELKAELKQAIIDHGAESEQVRKKREQIAKLTGEIKKNQQAMGKNQAELRKLAKTDVGANIELLKQFLAGDEMSFKYALKKDLVGVNHVMLDRVAAQEKLNQLLEEERKQQEAIAKLEKAKADLAFLQQQLSIVQLIKDNGLNPADIFGGIQLGLDASINDLLAVTSNLVAAMVDQINQDLQIASPSKVMAKIGGNIGKGLIKGVEATKGAVQMAMGGILPSGMSGGDSYSTVKNANTNIVINAAGNRRVVSDIMMLRGRVARI